MKRSSVRAIRLVAATIAASAVLGGCSGCGSSAAAPVVSSAPPTPSTTASDGTRIVRFGSIGDLAVGDTIDEIGTQLAATIESRDQGGCGIAHYEADDPLTPWFSVVAESRGPEGPVDFIGFGVPLNAGEAPPDGLPKTAEGIGVGTSVADLRAAYGKRLAETKDEVDPAHIDARVRGGDDLLLIFTVTDGRVVGMATGHAAQLAEGVDPCAES